MWKIQAVISQENFGAKTEEPGCYKLFEMAESICCCYGSLPTY